ncbi:hypothetical protein FB45DRAFT_903983 [Roridomyces roridus]|uniref:Uncharacterized protein n=1 Tax=Roridomyces roridus TaxID=1738132 RepID=A0AAD7FRA7_9AGAR|nr:hypothetical protein FB45DRAFT_903983 [Roridomyces roridus]
MPEPIPPTDFSNFVLETIKSTSSAGSSLDQGGLRTALSLSSSFLLTDTVNPETGVQTWYTGLNRLVDLLVALHARNELELATLNEASKACSECWTVAGTWRELQGCREGVRKLGSKLRTILDENGLTYHGETVYSPLAATRPTPTLAASSTAQ